MGTYHPSFTPHISCLYLYCQYQNVQKIVTRTGDHLYYEYYYVCVAMQATTLEPHVWGLDINSKLRNFVTPEIFNPRQDDL